MSRSQAYAHPELLAQLEVSFTAGAHGEGAVARHEEVQAERREHRRQCEEWSKQRQGLESQVRVLAQRVQALTLERDALQEQASAARKVVVLGDR